MNIEQLLNLIEADVRNLKSEEVSELLGRSSTKQVITPALAAANIAYDTYKRKPAAAMKELRNTGLRVDLAFPEQMPLGARKGRLLSSLESLTTSQFIVVPVDAGINPEDPWKYAKKLAANRIKSPRDLDPSGDNYSEDMLPFAQLRKTQQYITLQDTIVCAIYGGNQGDRTVQLVDLIRAHAIDALLDNNRIRITGPYCGKGDSTKGGRKERNALDVAGVPSLGKRGDYELSMHYLPFFDQFVDSDTIMRAFNFGAEHYCGKSGNLNMASDRITLSIDSRTGDRYESSKYSGAESMCFHKIAAYLKAARARPNRQYLPDMFPKPSRERINLYLKAAKQVLKQCRTPDNKTELRPLGVFDIENVLQSAVGLQNDQRSGVLYHVSREGSVIRSTFSGHADSPEYQGWSQADAPSPEPTK